MIGSFLIGIGGMIFLMIGWALVQSLWRKSFSDYISDDDVLADRRSCGNCGCTTICENKREQLSTK
ncbi:MAG: hypothetical protein J5I94_11825 [Phaeodactylibacter sp.]|nr:hypothetical protein [Phaeodactylibacter sp.]